MKQLKPSITIIALFFGAFAYGQIGQGTVLIGGVAGFDVQFEDPDNLLAITISPDVGFFVADNIAVGGSLGLDYTKQGDNKITGFSIAPFGRIYFGGNGGPAFFVQGQVGYATSKFENDSFEVTSNGPFFGGGPGVAIFLSDEVAIDGALLLTRRSGDFDHTDLGLFFGVQAYLGRGK